MWDADENQWDFFIRSYKPQIVYGLKTFIAESTQVLNPTGFGWLQIGGVESSNIFSAITMFKDIDSGFFWDITYGGNALDHRLTLQGHAAGVMDDDNRIFTFYVNGQMGVNCTPHDSAQLQISTGLTPRGFLPPSMPTSYRTGITSPAAGLMVYDWDFNKLCYWNGTAWRQLTDAAV